ncbi:17021_t:CDS:2 [Funneliformis caledonium]|uniref:17021_t:CDS:1 n=1 Tax=Funneliformis caledonium TaxID=1117310 RepID=A0A9N8VE53_9GLOM|nr:17021_t:CDS:2 [Funneliformis caledonium]
MGLAKVLQDILVVLYTVAFVGSPPYSITSRQQYINVSWLFLVFS